MQVVLSVECTCVQECVTPCGSACCQQHCYYGAGNFPPHTLCTKASIQTEARTSTTTTQKPTTLCAATVNIELEEQDAHRSRCVPELVHGSHAIAAAVTHSPGRSRQHHTTKQSTLHIHRYTDHLMVMRRAINRLVLFHTLRHRFTKQTGGAAVAAALRCGVGHKGTRLGSAAVLRWRATIVRQTLAQLQGRTSLGRC